MGRAGGMRAIAASAGIVGSGLCALAIRRYRSDIRRARERVAAGGTVVETPSGPIEYGSEGDGSPVLVVHGAGGGYDQGLEVAGPLVRSGFRVIAMSRFGYLGTPLPADASATAQADAHARLLDALEIRCAAVVGASAGAPSSMQFALRHPDRTAALVLLVPLAYPAGVEQRPRGAAPARISPAAGLLLDAALEANFLFWAVSRVAHKAMIRAVLGTPPGVLRNAGAEERRRVALVLNHVQPLNMRRLGLLNDAAVARSLPRYELERIAAPTLVLGVADCLYGTWAGARYSAEHIPGARFVSYPTGGHLWVGHQREVMGEIASFLREEASASAP
jgi:2-hydroxy-6-oxonona-2,4-dienedioate hydrolase